MIRTALAALVLVPALAGAQPAPGPRQDRRELADDRRDAMYVQQLLARFDDAAGRRDKRALRAVEADVARLLESERREARVEVASARAEVRDERRDVHDGRGDPRDDRRDLRDDRRDLRDDRRDLQRVKELDKEWSRLRGRIDRRSVERKRAVLVELARLTRAEVHEDGRELREDRREVREDRRDGFEHRR
jgi:hypothetical protein